MRCVCTGAVSLCNTRHATDDMPEWDRHGQVTRSNRERALCIIQHMSCKMGQATDKRHDATGNVRHATCNGRLAEHVPDELRRGPGDRQRTPRDTGHWGGQQENGPQTTCSRRDPTNRNAADDARDNVQGTTGNFATDTTPQATRNRENATDDTQRATENGRQQAPCSGRHATRNKHSVQQATCSRHQTS